MGTARSLDLGIFQLEQQSNDRSEWRPFHPNLKHPRHRTQQQLFVDFDRQNIHTNTFRGDSSAIKQQLHYSKWQHFPEFDTAAGASAQWKQI
jgi:hypothetical protein